MPRSTARLAAGFLLVFLTFSAIYITAVVYLDDTNLGTTNGMWKTRMVRGWEKGTRQSLDSGEWLYGPFYGYLCRAIPDRWVVYGAPAPVVTFRKMAMWNGVFGGLAAAAVFLVAMQFLASYALGMIAALAHACAAFVIVNSVNSEDIIPSYTFFVLAALFLIAYLRSERLIYLFATASCCALVTLLHWTQMIPALAGAGLVTLAIAVKNRRSWWALPLFFASFLALLALFMLGFGRIHSMVEILYPGKASPDGYVGFRWTKLIYTFIGIGNYFVGGGNYADYNWVFASTDKLAEVAVSWIFAAVTLGALLWALFRRATDPLVRWFALFALTVFCVGQVEHLYSQPADPQSQLQPMFAGIAGVIVILLAIERLRWKWPAAAVCVAVFCAAGAHSARSFSRERGADSRGIRSAAELASLFPIDSTVIVTHGWESFNAWIVTETFEGNVEDFATRNFGLTKPFIDHRGVDATVAADQMAAQIATELAHGRRVVSNVVWIGSRDNFARSLSMLVDDAPARVYAGRLFTSFHTGRHWNTSAGEFVELEK